MHRPLKPDASLRGFAAPTEMRAAIAELGWCMSLFGVLEYLSILWLHALGPPQTDHAADGGFSMRIGRLIDRSRSFSPCRN